MSISTLRNDFINRLNYEISFSLAERFKRRKEKLAMFVAWNLIPKQIRMWVIYRALSDCTTGEYGNVHPDSVSAFDLVNKMK